MTQTLKAWFADAHEGVSNHPQTADFILPRMALSLVDPRHNDRLRTSCHSLAARAIAGLYNERNLKPDDRIVMITASEDPKDKTIAHTIITTKDGRVKFDSLDSTGRLYNHAAQTYKARRDEPALAVGRTLSIGDFFKDYVSKITVAGRPTPSAP